MKNLLFFFLRHHAFFSFSGSFFWFKCCTGSKVNAAETIPDEKYITVKNKTHRTPVTCYEAPTAAWVKVWHMSQSCARCEEVTRHPPVTSDPTTTSTSSESFALSYMVSAPGGHKCSGRPPCLVTGVASDYF